MSHPASSSTRGGGDSGGGDSGGGFLPQQPHLTPSPEFSSFGGTVTSSSSSISTTPSTTGSTILTATNSPQSSSSSRNNTSLGIIIGASVGGMVLGALAVALLFFLWRRRTQRRARQGQNLVAYNPNYDQDKGLERKATPLEIPMPATPLTALPRARQNNRVADWVRRNNVVSVSTISSFSSPTVLESAGNRTSVSMYSQDSSGDVKPTTRPPGLYIINE